MQRRLSLWTLPRLYLSIGRAARQSPNLKFCGRNCSTCCPVDNYHICYKASMTWIVLRTERNPTLQKLLKSDRCALSCGVFNVWMSSIQWTSRSIEVRNGVEHLSSPQQVHEIGFVKTSTKHSSMRNDRISIILTALNSAQFIVQFTSLKLYSICGNYQLGSKCSNCMSFEVRRPLLALLQVREFWIIWNFLTGSRLEETRHELSMVKTHNNLKCYSSVCVVFLYRVSIDSHLTWRVEFKDIVTSEVFHNICN